MKVHQFNWGIHEFLYLQKDEKSDTVIPLFDIEKKEFLSKLKGQLKFIDSIDINKLREAKLYDPEFGELKFSNLSGFAGNNYFTFHIIKDGTELFVGSIPEIRKMMSH